MPTRRNVADVGSPILSITRPHMTLATRLTGALLVIVLWPITGWAQTPPRTCNPSISDPQAADASILCVTLYVKDGALMARGQPASRLHASDVIDAGQPLGEERRRRVEATLLHDIAHALAAAKKISYYALTDDERARFEQLDAGVTGRVDALSAPNWEDEYVSAFEDWSRTVDGRRGLGDSLLALVQSLAIERVTGLVYQAGDLDAEIGVLRLHAIDLTPALENSSSICFNDRGDECDSRGELLDRAGVARVLQRFSGKPWRQSAIHATLEQYYADRGLLPTLGVSDSTQPRRIDIHESDRLTRILWSKSLDVTPVLVDEFLSVLLRRRDFAYYSAHSGLVSDLEVTGQPTVNQLNYRIEPGGGAALRPSLQSDAPLYNVLLLPPQQAELDALGLILTVEQQAEGKALLVQPTSAQGPKSPPESAPGMAVPQPAVQGTARSDAFHALPTPTAPAPAAPDARPVPPQDKRRFIGIGAEYRPGQHWKPFVQFQQSSVNVGSAVASLSAQAGVNHEAFGSGSGRIEYLWFTHLRRKLSAEFSGGTDFSQDRIIAGVDVSERRNGAWARLEYEALGGADLARLTLAAEARTTNVALEPREQPNARVSFRTVAVSATYSLRNLVNAHPFHLSIEPSARLGYVAPDAGGGFASAGIVATLNQHAFDRLLTTIDVSGRFQAATADTPLVEQPSLGGADTLRGFRTDDAIGTTLWSLQPELWFDISGLFGRSKAAGFVQRTLRIAAFADAGTVSGPSVADGDSFRWGPGVGVRILRGPIALKVDWARGIGRGASGPGRGRLYLGATTARTF